MIGGILLALIALSMSAAAQAQCVDYAQHMHWLGGLQTPGAARCIAVDPNARQAYLAPLFDGTLLVVDIADPHFPSEVDTLSRIGEVSGIALDALHAYLAVGSQGVVIVDRSNPEALAVVSTVTTPGEARDVAIRDHILCVADWDAGLQLYDVSNPETPSFLGGIDLPGFAVALAVAGDIVFVTDMVGLLTVDISTPSAPVIVGSVATSELISDIALRGDDVFMAAPYADLLMVDCSDPRHPSAPIPIATYSFGSRSVAAGQTHVVVASESGVSFVDLTVDPPANAGHFNVYDYDGAFAVALDESRTLTTGYRRLDILEVGDGMVSPITEINMNISANAIDISGNIACATGNGGFQTIDVSDPSAPLLRGEIQFLFGNLRAVAMQGTSAILGREGTLLSIDISNPDTPVAIDTLGIDFDPTSLTRSADLLYATGGYQGFRIVDVQDPDAMQLRGGIDLPGHARDMKIEGSLGFISGTNLGGYPQVTIVDVSKPDAPSLVGAYECPEVGAGEAIAVRANLAYLTSVDYNARIPMLSIVDVSNPNLPVLRGSTFLPPVGEGHMGLQLDGDFAYICTDSDLHVVDVSDPTAPTVVGSAGGNYGFYDLRCSAGHIFLVRGSLLVLPAQCQSPAPVELSRFEAAPVPGAIQLTWHTSREWDHLGFFVERSGAAAGTYHRLTELIPPPSPYTYLDRDVAPGVTYFYRLAAVDRAGRTEIHGPVSATATASSTQAPPPKPNVYQLAQSYPNPFEIGDRKTAIAYSLASPGRARLRVFDATGRLVATLVNAELPAGEHLASWDGRTVRGETAPAGTYFYRLEAGSYSATQQLVRLR